MAGRIALFGATGYTGALTAAELAACGLPTVLAGRDRRRLEALAARVGGDLAVATADAADPKSVRSLLDRGDVLVTCVGPFARYGRPVLRAAIDAGADYIDSTGEPSFARAVFDDFGADAERAGVVLLPAFGYDCVPGNVAAGLALEDAGSAATEVEVGYFVTHGRPSGGTVASLLSASRAPSFSWRDGALQAERSGVRTAHFDVGGSQAIGLSFGGSEHLALPRSYPRLRTIGTYLGWFGPFTRGVQAVGAAQAGMERLPGVSLALDRLAARVAPGSSGGPHAAARARMTSTVVAVARDSRGRRLASVRLEGVDVYTLTARLLAWAAVRVREGPAPPAGARGPVEAFGLEPMARALAGAGLPRVA